MKIWNGTTASYDVSYEYYANGWLKAVKSGAQTIASYSYDDNGALTAVKTADGQTEQQSFTYHPNGLMNQASFNNQTQTLTNVWDADEHRVKFSIGENNYTAVFDVTAGIPAVIKEVTPQGTVYYVREPGGELICRVVGESRWYYHFDELGSTRLITHDSGAVTDRYAYDAYGAVISHDRNSGTIDQPYQYVGQLGYYTHWQAPEFGWLQLGVRFYEPEMGRFERRDPVPLGMASLYSYTFCRPTADADPSGLLSRAVAKEYSMACRTDGGQPTTYYIGDTVESVFDWSTTLQCLRTSPDVQWNLAVLARIALGCNRDLNCWLTRIGAYSADDAAGLYSAVTDCIAFKKMRRPDWGVCCHYANCPGRNWRMPPGSSLPIRPRRAYWQNP